MPGNIRIFPPAQERLWEIWDYTETKWGEEQANLYISNLMNAMERASRERFRWRIIAAPKISKCYFIRHAHHFVFFRELSDGCLGIITILHESMDLPARLKDDDTTQA